MNGKWIFMVALIVGIILGTFIAKAITYIFYEQFRYLIC
jgi:uncharacterized protein YneF (UPF0154 family)